MKSFVSGPAHALCAALVMFLASGCANRLPDPPALGQAPETGWARGGDPVPVATPWLGQFGSEKLNTLVATALANNNLLRQSRATVREAGQGVTITGSALWPSLSTSLRGSRRRLVAGELFTNSTSTRDDFTLSANLNWQVDLWGELRAAEQAARLTFAGALADYVAAEQNLAADVARRYFSVVESAQLEKVFAARLTSLEQSLEIIESGYRGGINGALDVYLAQNSVAQERGNLAAQRQLSQEARAALELLLADYPAGQIETPDVLPDVVPSVPVGLPTTLVSRRADLQSSWLALLAADARVAVAHRQRFPTLAINASLSDTKAPFNELISGGPLAWSLAGTVVQPLFQAGRLRANERQARIRLERSEAGYLGAVFAAFAEVENSISQEQALVERLAAAQQAQQNAGAALELSFEQYRAGIVGYATVLESQRRAFDAQTATVRLSGARLQNRITLNQALGGDFDGGLDQRVSTLLASLGKRLARRGQRTLKNNALDPLSR